VADISQNTGSIATDDSAAGSSLGTVAVATHTPLTASGWRHATDVRLSSERFLSSRMTQLHYDVLARVLALPHLQVLTLVDITMDHNDASTVQQLCTAAKKLQALLMFSVSPMFTKRMLPQLTQLRVLVLGELVPATSLVTLTQLHYIHMTVPDDYHPSQEANSTATSLALRWLSVNHALRCVSVEGRWFDSYNNNQLSLLVSVLDMLYPPATAAHLQLQPPIESATSVLVPRLEDLSLEYDLAGPHLKWLSAIPTLIRLQTQLRERHAAVDLMPAFSRQLQESELRVTHLPAFEDVKVWSCIAQITQLRSLRTQPTPSHSYHPRTVTLQIVSAVLDASSTLETIDLAGWLINGQQDSSWAVMAQCQQLRSLFLLLRSIEGDELLTALSQLPHFHTLSLRVDAEHTFYLPDGLLHHMTSRAGSQWRTLHLHVLQLDCKICARGNGNNLNRRLPPAEAASDEAARLLRVAVSKEECAKETYVIVITQGGQRTWQRLGSL
jgi:hypothetical protein